MLTKNPGQTHKDFLQLKGNVKQLMQTVYKTTVKNNEITPGKIEIDHGSEDKNFIYTFNAQGNITQLDVYGENFRTITELDHLGRRTKELKYYNGNFYSTTLNTYYGDTHQITEHRNNDAGGNLMYRYTNTYNDIGQITEQISYQVLNGVEIISRKQINTYRDEVKTVNNFTYRDLISSIQYDKNGKITQQSINTYNEKGLCTERETTFKEKSMAHASTKTTYKYNEQGDVIETNNYNADGSLKNSYVTTHEYDSEGKKITPVHNPQPYIHYPSAIMLTDKDAETDTHGNWIKKITKPAEGPGRYIIRELVYEGADKTLEHPLSKVKINEETEREPNYELYKLEKDEAKWLAEWGTFTPDNFPYARYYTLRFKEAPSLIYFQGPHIEAITLLERLKENYHADVVHTYSLVWNSNNERLQRYTVAFPHHWGYLLHCHNIVSHNAEEFSIPDDFTDDYSEQVYTSQISLLCPSEVNSARDNNFEQLIDTLIDECSLRKKPEKPVINIIEVKSGNYAVKEYAVNDDFIIKDLDINYGRGFEKFHNELMQRFNTSTKGLVLFHGIPGTGKTYYIRHLLRKMVANRKDVIYIPPNMVDHLVDPSFMTFLSNELKSWSEEGHTCVLLIEDAEPLLAKREAGIRIQGVTNLLNMTDGLLNDMLNIQIICTFNVDLRKLDSALLRPGRLIARKEFKALSELDANLLAQRLGIKHHFTKPATLGEIYALQKNKNTLIHDVEHDKGTSNAIDDLI